MCSDPAFLNLIMELVYVPFHGEQYAFRKHIWRSFASPSSMLFSRRAADKGASKWGLLKSYQEKKNGWISLDYTAKV